MRGMEKTPGRPAPAKWQRLSSRVETRNPVFRLRHDLSVSPRTGEAHEFVVLEAGDWVSVVAVTVEQRLVGIRQYRHGSREVTLEIPGGLIEPGLSPLEAAQEELRQETGYGGGSWRKLGELNAAPALFSNRLHVFLAEGVVLVGEQDLDAGEDISVELLDLAEVPRTVASGAITHAQVVGSLYLWELAKGGGHCVESQVGPAARSESEEQRR